MNDEPKREIFNKEKRRAHLSLCFTHAAFIPWFWVVGFFFPLLHIGNAYLRILYTPYDLIGSDRNRIYV